MPRPLSDIRIVEMAAIGPIPLAAMLLSSMGAEIIRVAAPDAGTSPAFSKALQRGRPTIVLDLKKPEGRDVALSLCDGADVLLEGFRPGTMERLGLGPEHCRARNQRLVYARMTGWGQTGPLAPQAGHDINYIAMSGVLHAIGADHPVPPLNLVGDYGGGSMFLIFGVLCAFLEAQRTGRGQVIDCAMADGAAALMTTFYDRLASGQWRDARGANRVDGGAPFYTVYETSDAKHVAVGALEDGFWRALLHLVELDEGDLPSRDDPANWPTIRAILAEVFKTRTRDDWAERASSTDACVSPVLSMTEAPHHPHNVARAAFAAVDGAWLPSPAPRLGETPAAITAARALGGSDADAALRTWGVSPHVLGAARTAGALA